MPLTQTVAPATEPVTVAEFKTWIGLGGSDMDTTYTNLLLAAREWVESYIWRQLITATYTLTLPCLPKRIVLPRPPLGAVSSIAYVDQNGNSQTLATSYYTVTGVGPAIITEAYNQTYPVTRDIPEAVTVTFTAGYGASSTDVPEPIRTAILLLAHMWNRSIICDDKVPQSVKSMLSPYKLRDERMLQGV